MKEIEAKIKLDDSIHLDRADLTLVKDVHVLDTYFDTSDLRLKSLDQVLRLRKENDINYLAFKGGREKHDNLLVREEHETEVESFDAIMSLLKGIDYRVTAKIEKKRQYYKSTNFPGLSITTDLYPFIGKYLEVEGGEDEVYGYLKKNNIDLKLSIQKNCTELFLDYCANNKMPFDNPKLHFTFEAESEVGNK